MAGTRLTAPVLATVLLASCSSATSGQTPESKQVAEAALAWIRGEGRAAVVAHTAAGSLLQGPIARQRCEATGTALDGQASPAKVRETIENVPDMDLRLALAEEQGLLHVVLGACLQDQPPPPDLDADQLRDAMDSVAARIRQLEEDAR